MQAYSFRCRIGRIAATAAAAATGGLLLYGCATGGDSGGSGENAAISDGSMVMRHQPVQQDRHAADPPLAIVDGVAVRLRDLAPAMIELAGTEALAEVVLDRRLAARAAEEGVTIDIAAIDRERSLLASTLSDDPDTALRLLRELRSRQGLGPMRFDALLRRNALLRALVADEVEVNEAAVRGTFDLLYGERRQARIIIVPALRDAEEIMAALRGGRVFSDLAIERSTDSSAARGGLLEPISSADPTYPQAIRSALASMQPGEISTPIMLEGGFAILKLERVVPASDTPFDDVRAEVIELARRNQERLLMQELASRLVNERPISIVDEVLREAWQRRE